MTKLVSEQEYGYFILYLMQYDFDYGSILIKGKVYISRHIQVSQGAMVGILPESMIILGES